MDVQLDWSALEKIGGIGLAIVVIYFGFQIFKLVTAQWQNSTDAVNKNTEAFRELSKVFEKSHERELEFQTEMRERVVDTQKKVSEIHQKIV